MTFEVISLNNGHSYFETMGAAIRHYKQDKSSHTIQFVLPSGELVKIVNGKVNVRSLGEYITI